MTHEKPDRGIPDVSQLDEKSAYVLFEIFAAKARLKSAGAARWASAVADVLLARLSQLSTGVLPQWSTAAEPPDFDLLSAAELEAMLEHFAGDGLAFHDDPDVAGWCRQLALVLSDERDRRRMTAILQVLDRQAWESELIGGINADVSGIRAWSEISKPDDSP